MGNAKFSLPGTPDAPAGAKGKALFKSVNQDGNQTASLKLRTHGLDPGDYTVNGVLTSDGTQVPLGLITVAEPGSGGKHTKDTSDTLDVATDASGSDIGGLVVADSNGVAMLQGDLASPGSSGNLSASVPVIGGDSSPGATGNAKLKVNVKNGNRKDNFLMRATGVPPNSTFAVNVDDADTGTTVKSTGSGRVTVKKLPPGLGSISSVSLTDEGGGEVARADF